MPTDHSGSIFDEVVAILLVAAAFGALAVRLRQPLILAFIAVGVLVGPSGFGLVRAVGQLQFLAELGLALLLFAVGLKLDPGLIRTTGPVALAAGLGQITFTSVIGYFIALALGMTPTAAVYVAVAVTFSSTIIIVKLLSDKRETDSLHGRIAIGVLIIQDIAVVLMMIILVSFAGRNGGVGFQILSIIAKGAALAAGLGLAMYLILPRLLDMIANSAELLVLFAIAWAVALASVSDMLGFSKEIGAFLAGVSLAPTNYREILGARLVSLRDFLLLFFFIELGTRLDLGLLGAQVWAAIPLSLFVLIGKPLIVTSIMGLMGYRKRTSFLAGLALGQISEFSLILAALGLKLGHIGADTVGLVTLVGLVTIGLSSYTILYSHNLYDRLAPYLGVFKRPVPSREQIADATRAAAERADTILFGLGRYGDSVASNLAKIGRAVVGVDFDPQAVKRWNAKGGVAYFGDAEDPEFPGALPLGEARWVVSSVREPQVNRALIRALKSHGYIGGIAVTAHGPRDAADFREAGADIVFMPFTDAASQAVDLIVEADQREARRKMDKIIANLKDHYIVCGFGRMGKQIVKDFQAAAVPYVVIEWNPEQIPKLVEQDVPHIVGSAAEDATLAKAGVLKAKGLIAVTATDEENVFIVLTARVLNPKLYIVARSIQHENEDKLRRAGADRVMSPYVLGGHRIAAAILKPRAMDFLDVLQSSEVDVEIEDIRLSKKSPFVGKTIGESYVNKSTGATVLAVRRPGGEIVANPPRDFVMSPGDELVVMGASAQLDSAERLARGEA